MTEVIETSTANTLQNQIAVVTGGGTGIGAAIALRLARMGAFVYICGRRRQPLETTVSAIVKAGGRAEAAECNITDLSSVEAFAALVERKAQRTDILINNAAVSGNSAGPLHQMAPAAWDQVMNTNLRGVYYCLHSFVPMMIRARSGHIVNISSLAGKNPLPNGAAYSASKWGLNGLTYSVAEELRAHRIRVSVVCPGSVHTDLTRHEGKDQKKMLQPDDVAHVVAMLVTQQPQSFVSEVLLRPTEKP